MCLWFLTGLNIMNNEQVITLRLLLSITSDRCLFLHVLTYTGDLLDMVLSWVSSVTGVSIYLYFTSLIECMLLCFQLLSTVLFLIVK